MNVNAEIQELSSVTGLEVSPDIYTGKKDKFIVYSYTDERSVFWGDDEILADQVTVRIDLYTPPKFDYMDLKHQIRDYLESIGIVNEIMSWLETYTVKNNAEVTIRRTTFNVTITKER